MSGFLPYYIVGRNPVNNFVGFWEKRCLHKIISVFITIDFTLRLKNAKIQFLTTISPFKPQNLQSSSRIFLQVCIKIINMYTNLTHCCMLCAPGLELAWVPLVPGTCRNNEHHLWHPRILRFSILTGTRRAHSM